MTVYADYTADEQRLLTSSLEAAAVMVSAASLGRPEETVSEGFAAASLVLGSRETYVSNTLVGSVILALEEAAKEEGHFPDYVKEAEADGATERSRQTLADVVVLLDAKATAVEAAGYKRWLYQIATAVAEAGKEDQGFLGMGGVQVNDAERAVLDDIAGVLGIEP